MMNEPVGWVLHDLHTTNPNMRRINSLEEAQQQIAEWDRKHPEQAGRFIACALMAVAQ